MRGFAPVDGGYEAALDEAERDVLSSAARGVAQMLAPVVEGESPQDGAVARLVPDASDDDEVAAEFRRLTQDDVARGKIDGLDRFADLLDGSEGHGTLPWVVPETDAQVVATALTDIRLVVADRLELASDVDVEELHARLDRSLRAEEEGVDPTVDDDGGLWRFLAGVFVTTGWLQESLVDAMLARLRGAGDHAAP